MGNDVDDALALAMFCRYSDIYYSDAKDNTDCIVYFP